VPLRPFTSVEEMDETIVARWNEAVKPSHRVYLLGDVAWRRPSLRLLGRLNGHIKMAGGNHDHFRTRDYLAAGVEEVCGVLVFDNVLMTHVPVHPSTGTPTGASSPWRTSPATRCPTRGTSTSASSRPTTGRSRGRRSCG
jgi:calcineurin-like phosphoesterase family protein